jgi:predicted lipoprotein
VSLTGHAGALPTVIPVSLTGHAAKDKDKAIQIALDASKANSSFQKAFDGVFEKVDDKSKANVCGAINLSELKMRIENGPAI